MGELTALENLPSTENKRKRDSVWNPFGLDDVGADDEETGWDVDAIDKGWGGELVGRHLVDLFSKSVGRAKRHKSVTTLFVIESQLGGYGLTLRLQPKYDSKARRSDNILEKCPCRKLCGVFTRFCLSVLESRVEAGRQMFVPERCRLGQSVDPTSAWNAARSALSAERILGCRPSFRQVVTEVSQQ